MKTAIAICLAFAVLIACERPKTDERLAWMQSDLEKIEALNGNDICNTYEQYHRTTHLQRLISATSPLVAENDFANNNRIKLEEIRIASLKTLATQLAEKLDDNRLPLECQGVSLPSHPPSTDWETDDYLYADDVSNLLLQIWFVEDDKPTPEAKQILQDAVERYVAKNLATLVQQWKIAGGPVSSTEQKILWTLVTYHDVKIEGLMPAEKNRLIPQ